MNFMNSANPFQIPVCLQRADSQQRRRERFKRGFITVVAAIVVLLVGMLIEGCMTEKSTATSPTVGEKITVQPAPRVNPETVAEQKPNQPLPSVSSASQPPAAPAASESAATGSHVKMVYQVKSGDTLTRIARVHGTTITALKAANNMSNDRIVVGAKLKIPDA
jgi:LysM repeat protein